MSHDNNEKKERFDVEDIEENRTMAAMAYVLFFLPIVMCPDSKFGRFHANQSLVLFLAALGGWVMSLMLSLIPDIGWLLSFSYFICLSAMGINGLLGAYAGKANRLPLIGHITVIE